MSRTRSPEDDAAHDGAGRAARSLGRPRCFDREAVLSRALDVFWRRGYEPASVAELCSAMGINPPSLYAAFGSKAGLFLAAVGFYERTYWASCWQAMQQEPDVRRAIDVFFRDAAGVLLSPDAPCGCMVVLAAINVSPESSEVIAAVRQLRREAREHFQSRLARAVREGDLPPRSDVKSLAITLNTLLEGMSIQAHDGVTLGELKRVASHAVRLLDQASA
ncbi:MAG: TetR/AcrR family transcriptional regulator [Lautropia sp.]|nr:TetR/AcrR family transcriptional regulator [Lautropia sp.]